MGKEIDAIQANIDTLQASYDQQMALPKAQRSYSDDQLDAMLKLIETAKGMQTTQAKLDQMKKDDPELNDIL